MSLNQTPFPVRTSPRCPSTRTFVALAAVFVLAIGCADDDPDPSNDGGAKDGQTSEAGKADTGSGLPDSYGPLYSCKTPGQRCNAHNPCAINPICGTDKKCRPQSIMNCDDGLDCTDDRCLGMGVCQNTAKKDYCALPVRVGGPPRDGGTSSDASTDGGVKDSGASAVDYGVARTEIKCFKKGARRPSDVCMQCDPATDGKRWSPATGGSCNDGDQCTQNDYCQSGQCKGTYFCNNCADGYCCTTDFCDGKGGCLCSKLKSDWCLISKSCYKHGTKHPSGSCNKCDVKTSQSAWTSITNSCLISNKCYDAGDKHPLKCAECDPKTSAASWTVKGSFCLINNVCKKPGDLDAIGCSQCDPTTNKYGWTRLSGVCKIFGKCYKKAAKHKGGCAECDPTVNANGWTVKGSYCLINNTCYMPSAKDEVKCFTCDPTKAKYDWSAVAGVCKIGGKCYTSGAKHPGGCATCDTSKSQTSWTVTGTTQCLIHNVCRKSGDKDLSGCSSCDPTKSLYKWTALPGLCTVDGLCYSKGATNTGKCGVCDPTKSTTDWSPSGTGCVIDGACYAKNAKHSSGCGTCDPTKSQTSWTVSANSCIIGDRCYTKGTQETAGCGVCDPTKSASSWTRGSSCLVTHQWSKSFGTTYYDYPYDVAVDGNGNIYITGYYRYTIDFGGGGLTANSYDIYVASFTPSGKHRWSKNFGGSSSDYGYGVAVDGNGNVYVTGMFYNSINFGGSTISSHGSGDIFLASFDSNGKHRWSKGFGGTSSDYGYAVETDPSGNVYITGYMYYSANFGGGTLTSKGSADVFLASFDSSGKHRWSKNFGSTSSDYGYGLATDTSGNVYVSGYHYSTINFGGSNLTSKGSYDAFLAAFDSSGNHRWSKSFGNTSADYGYDVATDTAGNVYLTGYFYYSVDFGGGTLTSKGGGDIYLASFTSSGGHRWSKNFGGTSSDYGYGVATDPSGNVFITGYYYNSLDFGGGTVTSKGSYDAYLASFTNSGAYRWHRSWGSTSSDYGRKVAVDGAGNVVNVGYFYNTVDFGGGALKNNGYYDIYLVKLKQ